MNNFGSDVAPALQVAAQQIGRQLVRAFEQLDASTASVEARKLLHALFVHEAVLTSHQLFPDNDALIQAVEKALAFVRGKPVTHAQPHGCAAA